MGHGPAILTTTKTTGIGVEYSLRFLARLLATCRLTERKRCDHGGFDLIAMSPEQQSPIPSPDRNDDWGRATIASRLSTMGEHFAERGQSLHA